MATATEARSALKAAVAAPARMHPVWWLNLAVYGLAGLLAGGVVSHYPTRAGCRHMGVRTRTLREAMHMSTAGKLLLTMLIPPEGVHALKVSRAQPTNWLKTRAGRTHFEPRDHGGTR
jgi:hypothetical protein